MYLPKEPLIRLMAILLVLLIGGTMVFYENQFDHIIDWQLETKADTENFTFHSFQKGPFSFSLEGQKYQLTEVFVGKAIEHIRWLPEIFMYASWTLICFLLAIMSTWKRYAFLLFCGLIFVHINLIDLDAVGIFGSREGQKLATIVFMLTTLIPAYYVHAFKSDLKIVTKGLLISAGPIILLIIAHLQSGLVPMHYVANSQTGLSVACMIFIFLVAEEIIFLLLFIITSTKGRHNERHLTIFGLIYVGYLGFYYADLYGLIDVGVYQFDPLYLLFGSSLIAIWSYSFKQERYQYFLSIKGGDVRLLIFILGLISFSHLLFGTLRGNTPTTESMSYFSLYAHLGFGFFFLIYLIINYFTPLSQGLAVYRIAYKDQNFPYVSARLGGLVIVAAFFFYADREPQKQVQGARYNFIGDIHSMVGNHSLANQYYREGAVFAWDNHYSNYKLGSIFLDQRDYDEAIYRFNRATKKQPSPYAFVNVGHIYDEMKEEARIPGFLRGAKLIFPRSAELTNNLAVYLARSGSVPSAMDLLGESLKTEKWNQALEVNLWAFSQDSINREKGTEGLSTALQSNIFFQLAGKEQVPEIDPSRFDVTNLHSLSLLINAGWVASSVDDSIFQRIASQAINAEINKHLSHSKSNMDYQNGRVNDAIVRLENLQNAVTDYEKGFFINQLGLLCLEQGSALLAREYFLHAIANNHEEAYFNLAVADLEAGLWRQAKEDWSYLVARDSSFQTLFDYIQPILNNQNDSSYAFTYYRASQMEPELLSPLVELFTIDQQQVLLKKLCYDLIDQDRLQNVELYRNRIMSAAPYETGIPQTNAFNLTAISTYLQDESISLEDKYNLLVDAITVNVHSVFLLKRFCLAAVKMGLPEFAGKALNNLEQIIPSEEFDRFMLEFEKTKLEQENNNWSFDTE